MTFDQLAERAAADLRSSVALPESGVAVAGLERTRRRRAVVAGLTGLVVAAIAFGVVSVVGTPDREPPPAGGVRNGALVGTTGRPEVVSGGALALPDDAAPDTVLQFSADGRELFYATTDDRVAAWDLRAERSRTLTDCPRSGCVFSVAPDGRTVALMLATRFVWVDVATGDRRPYPFAPEGPMSWSPDGTRLAVLDEDGLHVVDLASGDSRNIDPDYEEGFLQTAQWSPDGERLAYVLDRGRGGDIGGRSARYDFSLVVVDADGSNRTVLTGLGSCVCMAHEFPAAVTWSPDGTRLAASDPSRAGTFSVDLSSGDERRLGPGATHLSWQPIVD